MMGSFEVTQQIINERQGLHLILGERYDHTIKPIRELLRQVVADKRMPLANVALALAKRADQLGLDPTPIIVAFADEAEGLAA